MCQTVHADRVRRFASTPAFMGFTGLTPSEYSSGARTRRGAITKAGPQLVRGALVESDRSYRHRPAIWAILRRRQAGCADAGCSTRNSWSITARCR